MSERTRSLRRPFVELMAPEPGPSAYVSSPRREPSSPLPALVCNWAAALFALGGVLLARRRRSNTLSAKVLHLPLPEDELRPVPRAA